MNNDEFKSHIASKTGIPEELLTGKSPEENLSLTASLLAFKRDNADTPLKSSSELFCEWFNNQTEEKMQNGFGADTGDLNESVHESKKYPNVQDGGEITNIPDPSSNRDKFEEWASNAGFGLGSF